MRSLLVNTTALLALCLSGTLACKSKSGGRSLTSTNPSYSDGTVSVNPRKHGAENISFRRRRSVETETESTTTVLPDILNAEDVFGELDIDEDGFLHIVEWSLEGGSVKDFGALLNDHDINGDEEISMTEFSEIMVKLRENNV